MFTDGPLTTAIRKTVAALDKAKTRRETGVFKAEGTKCVLDTADAFGIVVVYATAAWIDEHARQLPPQAQRALQKVTHADLERMTSLSTPPEVIALYRLPDADLRPAEGDERLVLALDAIQDPGNMGTIIRTADWFGIRRILCSADTADCFAPKVVQATMGAIGRVSVEYVPDLALCLQDYASKGMAVYGTFLNGDNLYAADLRAGGVIVIGNEGHGISPEVEKKVTHRITIPNFGACKGESLNAAIAAAITVSEFQRQQHG